jgi:hypothetical protein
MAYFASPTITTIGLFILAIFFVYLIWTSSSTTIREGATSTNVNMEEMTGIYDNTESAESSNSNGSPSNSIMGMDKSAQMALELTAQRSRNKILIDKLAAKDVEFEGHLQQLKDEYSSCKVNDNLEGTVSYPKQVLNLDS